MSIKPCLVPNFKKSHRKWACYSQFKITSFLPSNLSRWPPCNQWPQPIHISRQNPLSRMSSRSKSWLRTSSRSKHRTMRTTTRTSHSLIPRWCNSSSNLLHSSQLPPNSSSHTLSRRWDLGVPLTIMVFLARVARPTVTRILSTKTTIKWWWPLPLIANKEVRIFYVLFWRY